MFSTITNNYMKQGNDDNKQNEVISTHSYTNWLLGQNGLIWRITRNLKLKEVLSKFTNITEKFFGLCMYTHINKNFFFVSFDNNKKSHSRSVVKVSALIVTQKRILRVSHYIMSRLTFFIVII